MEKTLNSLLREHRVVLKKAYGQNFLTDKSLLEEIVEKAGVDKTETVLEIGCGAGALTSALAEHAGKVVGYEIDSTLKPVLEDVLAGKDNVRIAYKDIMKESVAETEQKIGGSYMLIANLPYYITTPVVMKFVEQSEHMKAMVIMVQEEVARRFSASSGTPDYGAVTVGINLRGSAEILMRVPREKFTPVPNVDSAVVKIVMQKDKYAGADFEKVRSVVRAGFSSRRKMLVNNIMNFYKLPRSAAENALASAGIDITCRGEKLSAEDYVRLSEVLNK